MKSKHTRIRSVYDAVMSLRLLYSHCRLSRSAAGLSYYLFLALFPLAVCLSVIATQFPFFRNELRFVTQQWLSAEIVDTLVFEWQNPHRLSSTVIFCLALTLFVSASAGAFRCLAHTAADIRGASAPGLCEVPRLSGIFGTLFSYLFAVLLFFTVYISVFVMVLWEELLLFLTRLSVPEKLVSLFGECRFLLIFCLLFLICLMLQYCLQPKTYSLRALLPGSIFCTIGIVAATVYVSLFIRGSVRYSLIYGSLASAVLLLIWIYVCGNFVLLGVAVNAIKRKKR